MSLPPEILKKVKLLEINTRKLVNNVFAGEYHTAFKGQGMTFSEFREYVPGDDVRTISWPVTAKTGRTYIKKFDEEREMTLMLAVDVSSSSEFGSGDYLKGEVLTHLAALLCFSAAKNKDNIGLLLFSDRIEHFVPPAKGMGHVQRILRDLLYFKPRSKGTRISLGLVHLLGILKKRAAVFVMSDFIDDNFDEGLRLLGRKHDVIAVVIEDPLEKELPDLGLIELEDAETGEVVLVDSSSPAFRRDYHRELTERRQRRENLLLKAQVERIDISTREDYVGALIQFFKRRRRAR